MRKFGNVGLPIVSFDLAETRHTCQEAALYAAPNLVTDFARQVARLLDDSPLRERMGKRALALVETRWKWDYAKQNLLRAYARFFPRQLTVGGAANVQTNAVDKAEMALKH